ncbi:MAG: galactokinase, partial [Clostridia bacterium]|nr:galactokinase [Clostridia bacterium]
TATLEFKYVPVVLEGAKLVIACSNKKRGLADSKYNERRAECEEAVQDICHVKQIKHLGELTEFEFEQLKPYIKRDVCKKRAEHAVYENRRTIKAKEALEKGDIEYFGRLMNESHISLRDDYEVTGVELDTLVETAWKQEGVIGSRMTGAGFGGCTVSIVRDDCIDRFINNVGSIYEATIGYKADFYVVEIGDGPTEL